MGRLLIACAAAWLTLVPAALASVSRLPLRAVGTVDPPLLSDGRYLVYRLAGADAVTVRDTATGHELAVDSGCSPVSIRRGIVLLVCRDGSALVVGARTGTTVTIPRHLDYNGQQDGFYSVGTQWVTGSVPCLYKCFYQTWVAVDWHTGQRISGYAGVDLEPDPDYPQPPRAFREWPRFEIPGFRYLLRTGPRTRVRLPCLARDCRPIDVNARYAAWLRPRGAGLYDIARRRLYGYTSSRWPEAEPFPKLTGTLTAHELAVLSATTLYRVALPVRP